MRTPTPRRSPPNDATPEKSQDEIIPLDLSIALYRALPHAELSMSPFADHIAPTTPERAGPFVAAIADFARRHTTA